MVSEDLLDKFQFVEQIKTVPAKGAILILCRRDFPKDAVNQIIEDGYIELLSPERRFDQTLYFTVRNQG